MKNRIYLLALLALSLSFVVSCKEDEKKDEPEVPVVPPPAPTAADTLTGTWAAISGSGIITSASSPLTVNQVNFTKFTFTATGITEDFAPATGVAAWPPRKEEGTWTKSGKTLTNTITSIKYYDFVSYPTTLVVDSTKTNIFTKQYIATISNDTLTLVASGQTQIRANGWAKILDGQIAIKTDPTVVMTMKFKKQ